MNPGSTITITLNAQTEQANTAIRNFFGGLRDRVNFVKGLNADLQNGTRALNQFASAFGAVLGIGALRGFVQQAVEAGRASAQLEAALKATGQATKEYRAELEAQRQAMAAKVGMDDDELVSVQRLLVTFGVQRDQMKAMTALTLDYAAAMGTDAQSAATQLGRAIQGQDIVLRGMRIELDKTLPKTEQLQMLMEILRRQFGGQAEALADPIKKFNAQLKQTEQSFGRLFLDNLATPFLQNLGKGLEDMERTFKKFNENFPTLSGALKTMAADTGTWLAKIGPWLVGLGGVALAIKALQFALTPIGALARLARLGLALVAGADVVGLIGQVRNYKDLAAALDLIAKNTSLARAGLISLAAGAGYAAGRLIGSQVSIGGKTIDQHAQSAMGTLLYPTQGMAERAQLQAANYEFEASIIRSIDTQTKAGRLSKDQAKSFEDQMYAARGANLSVADYYQTLSKLATELRKVLDVSKTTQEKDFLFDQFLKTSDKQAKQLDAAKSAALAPMMLAEVDLENSRNEAAYKFGEISLQKYLDTRKYLIDRAAKSESIPLEKSLQIATEELEKQQKILDALVEKSDTQRANGQLPDYNELSQMQERVNQLLVEKRQLQAQLSAIDIGRDKSKEEVDQTSKAQTFSGAFGSVMQDLQTQWGSWAQQAAGAFKNVFQSAISTISSGISGLIMGTKTWGQALQQIGTSILTSIVEAIVQMGVQWVMTHVIMKGVTMAWHAFRSAMGWAEVAEVNAQESAKTPALATNAALASTGSFGTAAIIGIVALVAAIGLAIAAAAGAFAEGGATPGKATLAMVGEKGTEFVIPAHKVQEFGLPFFEGIRSGALAADDFISARGSTSNTSAISPRMSGSSAAAGDANKPIVIHNHYWDDKSALNQHLKNNPEVRHIIFDINQQFGS